MLVPGSWSCILLLFSYGVVATSIVTQSVPVIGDMARTFGVPLSAAGWMISIPSLVTAIGAMGGGWLCDRVGDRRVIFWGCLFALAGNLGVFFAQTYAVLMTSRLVEGFGYLALTVGAVTMIMRSTSGPRRSIALGLWTAHTSLGIGVTLILIAPLAQKGDQWRWAFGGHAVLMTVLLLVTFLLPKPSRNPTPRRLADIATVLRRMNPYRVAFASAASAFIQTGIMAALTVYLSKTYAVTIPIAATVGFAAEIVNIVGCLSVGFALQRGSRPLTLATVGGLITLAGGLALYAPGASFSQAAVATAVFGFGIGIVNGLIWALVPSVAPTPETLGATGGLVAQATYVGVLLGPPAIFSTLHPDGWTTRLVLVAVATILQLVTLPIWRRKDVSRQIAHELATGHEAPIP